jgi:hypothetical protein
VIWAYANNWSSLHTVTSVGNTTQSGSPLLNSGTLHPGQSYSYTFYQPGLYIYQCSYHFTTPTMSNASVNVTGPPIVPPTSQNLPDYTVVTVVVVVVAVAILGTLILFVRRKKQETSPLASNQKASP